MLSGKKRLDSSQGSSRCIQQGRVGVTERVPGYSYESQFLACRSQLSPQQVMPI